jgi:putative transposase
MAKIRIGRPCPCKVNTTKGKRMSQTQPSRKSIRLPEFDYSQPGAYFITINSFQRKKLFGILTEGQIKLSPIGEIVQQEWLKLPYRFHSLGLDEFSIMPEHFHGALMIYELDGNKTGVYESFSHPVVGSIPTIIRSYKRSVTIQVRQILNHSGEVWQRGYYEEYVEDEEELDRIREYINGNPLKE